MHRFLAAAACALLLGCSAAGSAGSTAAAHASDPGPATAQATATASTTPHPAGALPAITVRKHPSCGCCNVWIGHLREAGFVVDALDVQDMAAVKDAAGVPEAMASCHTAEVAGYFIEGHVPADDIARLLRERPVAKGLAVPGMPLGSPGMEHPQGIVQPYQVMLIQEDGGSREFSRYPQE